MIDETSRAQEAAERATRRGDWEDHFADMIKSFRREMRERRVEINGSEFTKHTRAARREMLMAFRSLLDDAIAHMDKQDVAESKATRITIE